MKKSGSLISISLILMVIFTAAVAQKSDKSWTEWNKKEVDKMLEESPWAQKQTETDTSQQFYSPTSDPRTMGSGSNDGSRLAQGATNQAVNIEYIVRVFSARPIREALARGMMLQQNLPATALDRLRQFAEVTSPDSIILTVNYKSNDQRAGNNALQAFAGATTASLKNTTYVQRSDGKQLFIEEYVPPGKDGFGARFIFLRHPDDKPFFDANSGEIHFVAQFPRIPRIDRRFKIAGMMYQGELEF
jgi:hypothetical protein